MTNEMNVEANLATKEIHDWICGLEKRRSPDTDLVSAIEDRIKAESDVHKLRTLNSLLAGELNLHGRFSDAEAVHMKMHHEFPDDPLPLISIASQNFYGRNNPEAALAVIDRAIEVAYRAGNFRRDALGVKARIALELEGTIS